MPRSIRARYALGGTGVDKIANSPVGDWVRMSIPVIAMILLLKFLFSLVPVPIFSRLAAAI